MKIRDNETGEVFEYGTDRHHALRISENGGCLVFENLQNGDGSLENGSGGYSFVLDDGKTPEESLSTDAAIGAAYANIGGFHGSDMEKDDGWIPVEERLPEETRTYIVAALSGMKNAITLAIWKNESKRFYITGESENYKVVAWRHLPEPYWPGGRSANRQESIESKRMREREEFFRDI